MSRLPRSLDVAVVDDDPTACRMMARVLRGEGHRVTEATGAVAALADPSMIFSFWAACSGKAVL